MEKNNLFNYATSELSQDAFLCWSINWINYDYSPLNKYGKAMLDLLLGDKKENSYNKVKVRRQYGNIDVLIMFKDKERKPHALIIEDKTGTSEHSNQMLRYKKKLPEIIEKDDILKEYMNPIIHLAYVKTGIIYDDERKMAKDKGATIVGVEDIFANLSHFANLKTSEILSDFHDYIKEKMNHRDSIKDQVERNSEYTKALFEDAYGQYYFLDKIFSDRERKQIGFKYKDKNKHNNPPIHINTIYSGMNNGGTPWTQFCFWGEKYPEIRSKNEQEYHYLFWRIDFNAKNDKVTPYISLRHYDGNRKNDDNSSKERKRFVYRKFREHADSIPKTYEKYKKVFGNIGVRENYKESDLVYITLEKLNGIEFERVKELIREITDSFLKKFNDDYNLYDGMEEYINEALAKK